MPEQGLRVLTRAARARQLLADGVRADSISADQGGAVREAAVARFRSGATWVLVATGARPRPAASPPRLISASNDDLWFCGAVLFRKPGFGYGSRLREGSMP